MAITTEHIKTLRERTGAGILDCKKALEATDGDIENAINWLREKGIAKAAKKADRIAAEGLASVALLGDVAVVCEINSETDFVAKNEKFVSLVKEVNEALVQAQAHNLETGLAAPLGEGTVATALVAATSTIGEKIELRRVAALRQSEGDIVGTYIHMGGKIATAVLLRHCQNEEVAHDVAMHVAASAPQYLNKAEIPASFIEQETNVQMEAAKNDPKLAGKPAQALAKIVEGKMGKVLNELSLADQAFIKNPDQTIAQYVKAHGGELGAFIRFVVGEGIQKREDNFAEEVMSQVR
ncbi:MAG: translation elongation factor Ts [Bacilli bacterium]|jgi:elongation factor Ts